MAEAEVEISVDEGATDNAEDSVQTKGFLKSKRTLMIIGILIMLVIAGAAYYFLVQNKKSEITENSNDTVIAEDEVKPTLDEEDIIGDDSALNEIEVIDELSEPDTVAASDPASPLDEAPLADLNQTEVFDTPSEIEAELDTDTDQSSNKKTDPNAKEREAIQAKLIEAQKQSEALAKENQRMQAQIEALKSQIAEKRKLLSQQQDNNLIPPTREPDNIDYQYDFIDDTTTYQINSPPPPKPSWGEFNRINKK